MLRPLMIIQEYTCPVCSNPVSSFMRPCSSCEEKIFRSRFETCRFCAQDLAGSDSPCLVCRENQPDIDGMKAIGSWNGPLREWLSQFKYGGDTRMAEWLSEKLFALWKMEWEGIPLVPVPPRFKRIFTNGIDPVGLLASGMQKYNVPVLRLLRRHGNKTQKSLGRIERLNGSTLKYSIKKNISITKCSYVLLDDVSTTGSTMNVCAKLLKSAGASQVFGLLICKD